MQSLLFLGLAAGKRAKAWGTDVAGFRPKSAMSNFGTGLLCWVMTTGECSLGETLATATPGLRVAAAVARGGVARGAF